MEVVSFNIRGKMAHFRKFYSNSSALTYFIPPRTTITGMIAGLLGFKRDSYYEEFSLENCNIAVTSCQPIKKTMQKMNYLKVESINDLNASKENPSPTPVEFVIPQNIRSGYVDYKIWFHHKDKEIMKELKGLLEEDSIFYKSFGSCMGLGTAFNVGWVDEVHFLEGKELLCENEVLISSSIPIDEIRNINILNVGTDKYKLVKEEFPIEFNMDRRITNNGLGEVLVNINGQGLMAEVNSYVELNNGENIMWIE